MFDRVTIVGLGLIGGSLGMALRRKGLARRVVGIEPRLSALKQARSKGAIDEGFARLTPENLDRSELVVIATPPLAVVGVAKKLARWTRHSFILTDAASTKGEIVQILEKSLPSRISFIGGHPMAGSERSGIGAASPRLFSGAPCIVTRTPRTDKKALARVSGLWHSVGGHVVVLSPSRHDALVAQISHVPHLVAVGLTRATQPAALGLAAGGFSDTTRIALGDPALWHEVCMTNRRKIAQALDRFLRELKSLRELVADGQEGALLKRLRLAQRKRRQIHR